MKTTSLLILLILTSTFSFSQKITISNHTLISTANAGAAYFPVFNSTGDKLLYSSGAYSGLRLYDFNTKSVSTVTDAAGAGYEPIFDQKNNRIFYRYSTFENGRKYDGMESFDIATGNTNTMLLPRRELRQVKSYNNGFLVAADKQILKVTFGRTDNDDLYFVTTEDLKMVVVHDGRKVYLNPLNMEESRYIWVSLSPDNSKILFTAAGKGTYICDLQGKILHSLNYLNAPVWYNSGYVVGMEDKDDGHVITSSTVQLVNIRTNERTRVSRTGETAMHPTAAASAGKIAYHTTDGKIYVTDVVIN